MATITFSCPSCGQVLRAGADKAGKKAKCVKCATIVSIPKDEPGEKQADTVDIRTPKPKAAPPPLPPMDEPAPRHRARKAEPDDDEGPIKHVRSEADEEDRPPGEGRVSIDRWSKVWLGVLLGFIASCMLIGYAGFSLLASILNYVAFLSRSAGTAEVAEVFTKIAVPLFLGLQLVALTGYGLGLFTPAKNNALALVIACIPLGLINAVVKTLMLVGLFKTRLALGQGIIFPSPGGVGGSTLGQDILPTFGARTTAPVLIILSGLFLILCAEWIVYTLFLRATAQNIKDRYIAGNALAPLFVAPAVVTLQLVSVILTIIMMRSGPPETTWFHVLSILTILTNLLLVGFAVLYMRSQNQVRRGIALWQLR